MWFHRKIQPHFIKKDLNHIQKHLPRKSYSKARLAGGGFDLQPDTSPGNLTVKPDCREGDLIHSQTPVPEILLQIVKSGDFRYIIFKTTISTYPIYRGGTMYATIRQDVKVENLRRLYLSTGNAYSYQTPYSIFNVSRGLCFL